VAGEADEADRALLLLLAQELEDAVLRQDLVHVLPADVVDVAQVEVVHLEGPQRGGEELLGPCRRVGPELGHDEELVPPLGHESAEGGLGVAVAACRVDVGDAAVHGLAEDLLRLVGGRRPLADGRRAEAEDGHLRLRAPEDAGGQRVGRLRAPQRPPQDEQAGACTGGLAQELAAAGPMGSIACHVGLLTSCAAR